MNSKPVKLIESKTCACLHAVNTRRRLDVILTLPGKPERIFEWRGWGQLAHSHQRVRCGDQGRCP